MKSNVYDVTLYWPSRGVPVHDLAARVRRLVRGGAEWHQRNP